MNEAGVGLTAGPLFLVAQGIALLAALACFGWRLTVPTRLRVALVVAAGAGCVAGALALGPLLRAAGVARGPMGWVMAFGALGGAALTTALAARASHLCRGQALDALAPGLGLLVLFGRLGCHLAGCCFGAPSPYLPHGEHPTALYEAALGGVVCLLGVVGPRRRRGVGFALAAVVYAVGRFAVEHVRADPRPMAGPLSLAQCLSLLVLAATLWWAAGRASPAVVERRCS